MPWNVCGPMSMLIYCLKIQTFCFLGLKHWCLKLKTVGDSFWRHSLYTLHFKSIVGSLWKSNINFFGLSGWIGILSLHTPSQRKFTFSWKYGNLSSDSFLPMQVWKIFFLLCLQLVEMLYVGFLLHEIVVEKIPTWHLQLLLSFKAVWFIVKLLCFLLLEAEEHPFTIFKCLSLLQAKAL